MGELRLSLPKFFEYGVGAEGDERIHDSNL